QAGVLQRYGVARNEADRSALVVGSAGQRLGGAAALNRVLDEIGGGWRTAAKAYRLRPIALLEEALYGWFARHRSRFSRLRGTACLSMSPTSGAWRGRSRPCSRRTFHSTSQATRTSSTTSRTAA